MPYVISGPALAFPEWGGSYYVAGKVTINGAPASRRVRLVDRRIGAVIREVMADADGSFRFDYVRGDRQLSVVGVDQYGVLANAFADPVTPVAMGASGTPIPVRFLSANAVLRLRTDGRVEAVNVGSAPLPAGVLRVMAPQ